MANVHTTLLIQRRANRPPAGPTRYGFVPCASGDDPRTAHMTWKPPQQKYQKQQVLYLYLCSRRIPNDSAILTDFSRRIPNGSAVLEQAWDMRWTP